MFNVAVLDDDVDFLNILKKELITYEDTVNFTYYNEPALFLKEAKQFDGLLTDFEMYGFTAFKVFEELKDINDSLVKIIITNYDNHVYNSFDYDVSWYMRKSDLTDKLSLMMDKLLSILKAKHLKLEILSSSDCISIPFDDIRYIETDKNYVLIHADEVIRVRSTFRNLLENIKQGTFAVPVYGVAVNMKHIKYIGKTNLSITIDANTKLLLSNNKKKEFLLEYRKYLLQ